MREGSAAESRQVLVDAVVALQRRAAAPRGREGAVEVEEEGGGAQRLAEQRHVLAVPAIHAADAAPAPTQIVHEAFPVVWAPHTATTTTAAAARCLSVGVW